MFTRAKFSINFRFVEFILKMKNVNCVLEFLYRKGSKNPRDLCERTGLSLATVYRKIGRIRNGESLEIKKGKGRPQKFSASQKKAITQIALRNPLFFLPQTLRIASKNLTNIQCSPTNIPSDTLEIRNIEKNAKKSSEYFSTARDQTTGLLQAIQCSRILR